MKNFEQLKNNIIEVVKKNIPNDDKLSKICELLSKLEGYDWVGFYIVNKENEEELLLGPFVGDPTEHIRIKKGEGICGQSLETGKTFLIMDVNKETNYLSCSPKVKSEIVVPIYKGKKIVGEIDIDSHNINNFKEDDKIFLEEIAEVISLLF